jgi:hypothetical protein
MKDQDKDSFGGGFIIQPLFKITVTIIATNINPIFVLPFMVLPHLSFIFTISRCTYMVYSQFIPKLLPIVAAIQRKDESSIV